MRFLVDACVDMRVGDWLRGRGHDVVHLREQGRQGLSDREIFASALADQRIVLTFDLDFGEIAAATGGAVGRVLVLRLRDPRWSHVVERLDAVMRVLTDSPQDAMVITVEESRHRIRHLPIGRTQS